MNRKIYGIVLLLLMGGFVRLWSQRVETDIPSYHFVYVSGVAAYNGLQFNQQPKSMTPMGYAGGSAEIGYEFRMKGGYFSVGLDYQMINTMQKVTQYEDHFYPVLVSVDKVTTYYYHVNQRDIQHWGYVGIPIMAGYYYKGFYTGLGFKYSFPVRSTASVGGTYYTTCVFDNLPNLEFNYESSAYGKDLVPRSDIKQSHPGATLTSRYGIMFEMGYDLLALFSTNSRNCHVLKVGVYGEYGLSYTSYTKEGAAKDRLIIADKAETEKYQDIRKAIFTPYFSTHQSVDLMAKPFVAGIKITYMFSHSSYNQSPIFRKGCACYYK